MDKFLVIDGSSLIHRAFFALPPLTNKKGQSTGAVFGLCNMLLSLLQEHKPKYMAVAFDKSRHSFRTDQYPDYKAQRKPTPSELKEQFPLAIDLLNAMGIPALEVDEYEADDIIGTFAVKAPKDVEVLIVTGDRDQLQLIDGRTSVLFTKHGIKDLGIYNRESFAAEYEGLEPKQIIDLKGLMGDASDNIPGVPGVGPKTALKLIKDYGSVENVLAHATEVSGKSLQQKLLDNKELALLSKDLATIFIDVDVDLNLANYSLQPLTAAAQAKFQELEFRNMYERFLKVLGGAEAQPTGGDSLFDNFLTETVVERIPLNTAAEAEKFFADNGDLLKFSVDEKGEIPQLDFAKAEFYYSDKIYFMDGMSQGWNAFQDYLAGAKKKIVKSSKTLWRVALCKHIELQGIEDDVELLAYLDNPGQEFTEDLLNTYDELKARVFERGMEKLYREIELLLVPVLARMEVAGIRPNMTMLGDKGAELSKRIADLEQLAVDQAGVEFNLKSPKQLGSVLFEKLNLPPPKKTKTGYSTDVKVLEALLPLHPIATTILEHRKLSKLYGTYIEGMGPLVNKNTGRIHTHFQQTVTQTGRLSSVNPNLQNIPTRTEEGKMIRRIFEPGNGYDYFMSCDYSQVELRILAAVAHDEVMLDAFAKDEDIHTRTAAEVFGVPVEQVTSAMRSKAKAVNFGIVYGISDYGLAVQLKVGNKEAAGYIRDYLARYQGVDKYMQDIVATARKQGYVETLLGRHRYLPDINAKNFTLRSFAERTAINTPIQGTAADIMKLAMIKVQQALEENHLQSRILLQVHDELLLEVTKEEKEQVAALVQNAMENAYDLGCVKLPTEINFATNWGEVK